MAAADGRDRSGAPARLPLTRRVLFAVCTALFVVALLELLLFAAERASGRAAALLRGAERAVPDARLGQRPNPALAEHDARGWRNAEAQGRVDVLAIGDSQTYGDEVAREDAWPQRLAALSGRSVYNMALGGYGPVEYERLLAEAEPLAPQQVLVGLYAGNDLADAYLSAYPRGLAPELRSADAELAHLCAELDRRGELKQAWERTRDARKGREFAAPWRLLERVAESSRLLALVRAARHAAAGSAAGSDEPSGAEFEKLARRAERAGPELLLPYREADLSTVFTPAARLAVIDTSDARVEEGLRIAVGSVVRMAERCAGRCRVAVVAIPSKELVFAEHVAANGARVPETFSELALRETLVWERVRRALADADVPLIDTLPALRALLASGRNPYRSDWNGHPNAAGNAAIAEAVLAAGVLDPTRPSLP